MANIKIVSATEARNKWFELLSWVNTYSGEVMIKRRNRIVAKIFPGEKPVIDDVDEILEKMKGRLKGKNVYFPYEDKKIIAREKKYLKNIRLWRMK